MDELIISIKKESEELINKMGFKGESVVVIEGKTIIVNYHDDEVAMLIGKGGEVLDSLQHLMRILLSKRLLESGFDLVVDVGGYKSKKAQNIARRAKEMAYQVLTTGIEEILPSMSSYERMIVHTTCSTIGDIETESTGSGKDRKVVIKPKRS